MVKIEYQKLGTETLDELRQDKLTKEVGYFIKLAKLDDKKSYIRLAELADEKFYSKSVMRSAKSARERSCIESANMANKELHDETLSSRADLEKKDTT